MAILAALIALGSRFATKILTTALGWATTLLFGRVPASRQIALLAITFGSVIWAVLVIGVIVPDVGTFLLLLVPSQDIVPEVVIRAAMLIGALVVPGVVGFLILWLSPAADRRGRGRDRVRPARLPSDRAAGGTARLPGRSGHLPQGVEPRPALDGRARAARRRTGSLRGRRARSRRRAERGWPRRDAPARSVGDVASGAVARPGRWSRVRRPGARPHGPAPRPGPGRAGLPDGPAHLGHRQPRHARSGRDGQPVDDVGRASDGQRRGPGDRGPAHPAGSRRGVRRPSRSSTTRPPSSWPRSTTCSRRSRSRTTNGRCCTASVSRSSAIFEPVRWPGRPPRSRSSNRSSACCGRAPRPSRTRPRTTPRSRPSIGSRVRSGPPGSGWRPPRSRPPFARGARLPTGPLRERASRPTPGRVRPPGRRGGRPEGYGAMKPSSSE